MADPGHLLRSLREQKGLTQRELAKLAETHQADISRIESGSVSPTVSTLERLLRVMGEDLLLTVASDDTRQSED